MSTKFNLPGLAFEFGSLAPTISEETIQYHYGKHHAAYVNNLNNLIVGTEFENSSLPEIVKKAAPGVIFNNAAQVWNHNFYWSCLSPERKQKPGDVVSKAIDKSFGSFGVFKDSFAKSAISNFGSGWTWLVKDAGGNLRIENTSNAETPFKEDSVKPLLTCDVWEHAYYIDYRNDRAKYVENFWKIVNWEFVEVQI